MTEQSGEQDSSQSANRKRWPLLVAASLVVALVIGGVVIAVVNYQRDQAAAEERAAAEAAAEAEAEAEAVAEREARREQRRREAAALARKQAIYDECQDHLSGLYDALDEVDARLNIGLSQSDFSSLVGDASVAYNRVDTDSLAKLGGKCLTSGVNLEAALNAYSRTASRWNDCIYDYACDTDSIDPMLQTQWATASRKIATAERLMESLDPATPGGSGGGGRSRTT